MQTKTGIIKRIVDTVLTVLLLFLMAYQVTGDVEQLQVTMLDGEEMDVKAVLSFSTTVFHQIPVSMIMDVKIAELDPDRPALSREVAEQVEINIRYEGYIERQKKQVMQFEKLEHRKIPGWVNYDDVGSLPEL